MLSDGVQLSSAEARVEDIQGRSVARKVDIRLPGKGNSNSRGARPVY